MEALAAAHDASVQMIDTSIVRGISTVPVEPAGDSERVVFSDGSTSRSYRDVLDQAAAVLPTIPELKSTNA
jgi:hypothetical protein